MTPVRHAWKNKSDSLLLFDEVKHVYTHSGLVIPGVTSVIEPLEPFGFLSDEVRKAALLRGTLVHRLTELHDEGLITVDDWEDIEKADLDGYLIAWEAFKQQSKLVILESEQRIFHSKYRYAGTFDRVIGMNGAKAILDIKTGSSVPAYKLQTAAYLEAYNEGMQYPLDAALDRYVVCLNPNGTYKLERHDDIAADFEVFVAALTIAQWKQRTKKHG